MKKLGTAIVCGFMCWGYVWGVGSGGFSNQVVGAKALGMGNAFTAVADDPSAVFFNPAGMTQLEGVQASLGVTMLSPHTDYKANSGATADTDFTSPAVPSFYLVVPSHSNWAVGFGVNSPFGLDTHWGEESPLRYVATDSRLRYVQMTPTFAYRVRENLSLAAGVAYARVDTRLSSMVNVSGLNSSLGFPSTQPDGGKTLEGDGDGWGYNLSLHWNPVSSHRVGFSYKSALKTKIEGKTTLSGLSGASNIVFGGSSYSVDTKTTITFPPSVTAGYSFQPGRWTIASDIEWVGYSTVDKTQLTFSGESDGNRLTVLNTGNPIARNWKDTWNFGLGANYKVNETWQARGGYFYFRSAVPEKTWDPSIPENKRHGLTTGGTWTGKALSVHLAASYVFFEDRKVNNDVGSLSGATVDGTYRTGSPMLALDAVHRF